MAEQLVIGVMSERKGWGCNLGTSKPLGAVKEENKKEWKVCPQGSTALTDRNKGERGHQPGKL